MFGQLDDDMVAFEVERTMDIKSRLQLMRQATDRKISMVNKLFLLIKLVKLIKCMLIWIKKVILF